MCQKKKCYVGFDTSNYTTSVAVCDEDGVIVANLKAPLIVKDGERGLRQSDAVFAHIKNLPGLTVKLTEILRDYEPVAVCYSDTPRTAEGSYMPCFLPGGVAAHAFAAPQDLPVYKTAHQNGHIVAAMYSAGAIDRLKDTRFLAFHVSGGTTEVLLVTPCNGELDINLVGETKDINAGQAIDRVGVMMGLSFPCGKALEKLAAEYIGRIEKRPISVSDGCCCLSGIENIAEKIYRDSGDSSRTAAFVFDFLCRTLMAMAEQCIQKYGEMPILFAGGVMSNKLMRTRISERFDAYFAEPEFSADNAAGVALICRNKMMKGDS